MSAISGIVKGRQVFLMDVLIVYVTLSDFSKFHTVTDRMFSPTRDCEQHSRESVLLLLG